MRRMICGALAGVSITAITMATPVWAQATGPTGAEAQRQAEGATPPSPASKEENQEDIVITGTQIRGVSPPGANVLSINRDQIRSTGATSTQQLLSTIPQTSA